MIEEIGRKKLIGYYIATLAISADTIVHYWVAIGTDKAPTQIARFLLTIGLLFWIHSGSQVARLISIALFWIGGVGFVMVAAQVYKSEPWWGIGIGINGLTYLFFARGLIWSREINAFLMSQRGAGK